MTLGSDSLMDFRTAYLRAIGFVWSRPDSHPDVLQLLDPSINALTTLKLLFGAEVNWNAHVRFTWNADATKRPQWRPRLSGGWVGGDDHHRITTYVPDATCLAATATPAEALAAYYAVSPTLFGTIEKTPVVGGGGFDIRLGSFETFEQFGGVFLRMLGLVWRIAGEPALAGLPAELFGPTPELAFQRWLGYRWPWAMDMAFVKCTKDPQLLADGTYVPFCMSYAPNTGWEFSRVSAAGVKQPSEAGVPPNEVLLSIPDRPMTEASVPVRDIVIEPLALAAYNQTGELYPLTCCGC